MQFQPLLCYVLRFEDTFYFFDAVTNDIYECDEPVARTLASWRRLDDETVRQALVEKIGSDRFEAAVEEIRQHIDENGGLYVDGLTAESKCPSCHDPSAYENRIGQMQMTVTEQCNLRCAYCPYSNEQTWSREHGNVYMSRETALAAADFFLERSAESDDPVISFYGGEPLLNLNVVRDVVDYVQSRAPERNVKYNLDTNGLLITDEVADFVAENKIDVQISLDGPKHVHDRYRRTVGDRGSYDRVMAGTEKLIARDPSVTGRLTFNAVLAPPYELEAVVDYFADFPLYKRLGITKPANVNLNFANLDGIDFQPRDVADCEDPDGTRAMEVLRGTYIDACREGRHNELSAPLRSLFDKAIVGFYHRPRTKLEKRFFPTGSCVPGQRKVHVRSDGSLMPCERGGDCLIIGHVDTGFDMDAIDNLHHKLIGSVGERCKTCFALRNCSICFIHMSPSWSGNGGGDIEIPEKECESIRASFGVVLEDYLTLKRSGPRATEWLRDTVVT